MMQDRVKKIVGFTLIELLLVIALLAVLASIAIVTYRRHAEIKRIDKAALETQQILQAAAVYFSNYQKWPLAVNTVPNCTVTQPDPHDFINSYLPNANHITVFGLNYCWGVSGAKPDDGQPALFWVALEIPQQQSAQDTQNIAQRIAARLPNAVTTSNPNDASVLECIEGTPCYVRAEVPQPGSSGGNGPGPVNGASLVALGYCQPGDPGTNKDCHDRGFTQDGQYYRITFTACPVDKTMPANKTLARIVATPNFYHYQGISTDDSQHTIAELYAKQLGHCRVLSGKADQEQCDVIVQAEVCAGTQCVHRSLRTYQGKIGLSYVVACMPKPQSIIMSQSAY